jgi:ADP-ribose pyrophosphatase YjhB (NUDIX family)
MEIENEFQLVKPTRTNVYGVICLNSKNEVLLVKGKKYQVWSFPKGHINRGETGLQCAMRELYEETSVKLDTTHINFFKFRAAQYYLFYLDDKNPFMKIRDTREIDDIKWCPITKLPKNNTNIDVSILKTVMRDLRKNQNVREYINTKYFETKLETIIDAIKESKLKKDQEKNSVAP